MEKCVRCQLTDKEIKIYDAIDDGKMITICERCSIIDNIPLIKRKDPVMLKEKENVRKTLASMREIESKDIKELSINERLKELDRDPVSQMPESKKMVMLDHFHWDIMQERRRKKLTQGQLAEAIRESEASISLLERGILPENSENLIKKLEGFFGIRLRKLSRVDELNLRGRRPILLDESGRRLDKIPEPEQRLPIKEEKKEFELYDADFSGKFKLKEEPQEIEDESEEGIEEEKTSVLDGDGDLDINKVDKKKWTIADLRLLHRTKVKATKEEKVEEQKKIQDRQSFIEAKKEELRSMKDKQSKDLDNKLGGVELLK
jgi:ribosome-binding protein aMBF1 (putative translation factor)